MSDVTQHPSTPPGTRLPRRERERQLLDLAAELFSERGYAGTSMDALAERAGVTKPVIYNLFGSKAGLFAACTSELGERLFETVAGAVSGIDDIDELVRAGSLAFSPSSARTAASGSPPTEPATRRGAPASRSPPSCSRSAIARTRSSRT